MGGSEQRAVKTSLDIVSSLTNVLDFKQTKDSRYAQWEIKKVGEFEDNSNLIGTIQSPEWGWDIYFKDEAGKILTPIESQVIAHETGHSIGLADPAKRETGQYYSQADTVMSINLLTDNNLAVIPFGYTSSDVTALMNWWNTGGFIQQEYNEPYSVGDFNIIEAELHKEHGHNHFEIKKSSFPVYKLDAIDGEIDFAQTWKQNAGNISELLEKKSYGSSPLTIKLGNSDNVIDFREWSGAGLKEGVSAGHLLVKGRNGDDKFLLRGNNDFENDIFAKDLVISGGKGVDTIVLDSTIAFPNAKAGMLMGKKVIRLYGEIEEFEILDGAKIINADRQQGVIIRNDVERIEINGDTLSFDAMYDIVQSS